MSCWLRFMRFNLKFQCLDVRASLNAPQMFFSWRKCNYETPQHDKLQSNRPQLPLQAETGHYSPALVGSSSGVFVSPTPQAAFFFCSCLGSFLRSFTAFLFLFLLRKFSSLPLFFSSWYFSASCSFFFSAAKEQRREVSLKKQLQTVI